MEQNEINLIQRRKEEYKLERNDYVGVGREEEKRFVKKNIVDTCKEPKPFYRFINGKIKQRLLKSHKEKREKMRCGKSGLIEKR